jgi:ubiquitin-activating enzyme E1
MLYGEGTAKGDGIDLHLAYSAVLRFEAEKKHWPRLHSSEDASAVVALAKQIDEDRQKKAQAGGEGVIWAQALNWGFPSGEARDLDEKRIGRFAKYFEAELTGFCAFLGGAIAQEVLKKTGKFTPMEQWLHHDDHNLITDESSTNLTPLAGTRYDYQIAVLGKDFQQRMADQRVFLVGCGALGCEYLKGLSLMGVGTNAKRGKIWVTDMDNIEVSNLSRQFLFRANHVGKSKSICGAEVVKGWNPKLNIEPLEMKVGGDSEDFFSDKFWSDLDLCWNALDNVHARRYTDSRCLWFSKPLLESGTLGTKCNGDVILPYRTKSYNDGVESDENETQIAMCTLRAFPFLPLHCIEFAKQSYFSDYYEFGPSQYESFRKDREGFFDSLDGMGGAEEKTRALTSIKKLIALQQGGKKFDFAVCLTMAFDQMQKDFRKDILDLTHNCDILAKASGKPFWTGTKRRPLAIDWDDADAEKRAAMLEYLYSAANLYAFVWGVPYVRSRDEFEAVVEAAGLTQPEWAAPTPSGDAGGAKEGGGGEGEDEDGGPKVLSEADIYALLDEFRKVDVSALQVATPHDFEKDEDENFHIDFLTSSTNMRAWNYQIKASARHHVKITAGRIIPAMATTTAMVCGLIDIEYCKVVLGLANFGRSAFFNSNLNLATGLDQLNAFNPEPAITVASNCPAYPEFSCWDKIEVDAPAGGVLSVKELVQKLRDLFGVETQ